MNAISDEEQVETLKRWWKENGSSLVFGVVLALVAVYGWQAWQRHQATIRAESSAMYQNMMEAYMAASQDGAPEAKAVTFSHLAKELQEKYPKTTYAGFAALQQARFMVQQGEIDQATAELEWVLAQHRSGPVAELARVRLARLLLDRGEAQSALDLVAGTDSEIFAVAYLELKGDALLALDKRAEASAAYQMAMELAGTRGESRPILEMKMYELSAGQEEA